jgi:hypothetical protein
MKKITPTISAAPSPFVIAGSKNGKNIYCRNPQLKLAYAQLKTMALAGNYWADLTVKGITSLSAGRLFQNNIFIRRNNINPNARGEFFMILPGFKATFCDNADGTIELQKLEIDTNYEDLQRNFKKPGLYSVKKDNKNYSIIQKNNRIFPKTSSKLVLISDSNYKSAELFLTQAIKLAGNTHFKNKSIIENQEFFLHFTPGNKGITGLKSSKELLTKRDDRALLESIQQLAYTMNSSKDIEDTTWISVLGGSAITHRALETLVTRSVKLEKHLLYLANPTSNANATIDLSQKLNMYGAIANSGWNPREIIGNRIPSLSRKSNVLNAVDGGIGVVGAAGTAIGLSPTISASIGAAIGFASMGTALSVIGGVALTYSTIKFGHSAYKKSTGQGNS